MNRQTNYHFSDMISVDNSLEKVWGYLTDVNKWKDWDTELKSAVLHGDFAIGAKGTLVPKKGPELPFHISEIVPMKSYTFKTKMPLGHLEIKRTLEKKDGMTLFTDDIQFTGILKRFFGLMLGRSFQKVLPEVMQNFKRLVEKE